MPELPEVETIRRGLVGKATNKKIQQIWIRPAFKKKISPNAAKFLKLLKGKTFQSVKRCGKMLIFQIGKDLYMLNHLKMTGQFVFQPPFFAKATKGRAGKIISGGRVVPGLKERPNEFTHVIFTFSDGSKLCYNDLRKFGWFKLVDLAGLKQEKSRFGVGPLEARFTFKVFDNILKKKKNLKIKTVLLDQKLIAGIGNIYADEACFLAGIKPTRRVKSLRLNDRKKLFSQIKKVLLKAIKYQGTSVNTYVDADGQTGNFRDFLKVYHRAGELCLKCKKVRIEKIKVGGRGTSFCSLCQK